MQALDQLNQGMEDVFKNYYTKEENENPWYKNVFSANFWGDSVIKNLGFSIGAAYSGGLYANALKAAGAGIFATRAAAGLLSSVGEASFEALNGSREFAEPLIEKENARYNSLIQGITDTYGENSIETQRALQEAEEEHSKNLSQISKDRANVGNVIFGINVPLLTASNNIEFGNVLAGGRTKRSVANNIKRANITKLGKEAKELVEETLPDASYINKLTKSKGILKGLLNASTEGQEEMGQAIASTIPKLYYTDKDEQMLYPDSNYQVMD